MKDCAFQVEDLRNGQVEGIHRSRLKFYQDPSLDRQAIMLRVLSFVTGMPAQHLLRLVDADEGLVV